MNEIIIEMHWLITFFCLIHLAYADSDMMGASKYKHTYPPPIYTTCIEHVLQSLKMLFCLKSRNRNSVILYCHHVQSLKWFDIENS